MSGITINGNIREWRPHALQQKILKSTARFRVAAAGRRAGKALALDTPIFTTNGWSTMGELKVGDKVFDENGEPCNVIAATEVMYDRPCYRLYFSDNSEIVADAQHQWLVSTRNTRRTDRRIPLQTPFIIKTTEELTDRLSCADGQNNYQLLVAEPCRLDVEDLPIDPYVLGAWLGDGTSTGAQMTSDDPEILEEFAKAGYPYHKLKGDFAWSISDGIMSGPYKDCFQSHLRESDLLRNKHIPDAYFTGSIEQRWALVQGLMDTDGSCNFNGRCVFYNTDVGLAYGMYRLLSSLGVRAVINIRKQSFLDYECLDCFVVGFRTERPAFRLPRKLETQMEGNRHCPIRQEKTRSISLIRKIDSVPVRCIEVDSPSHLYLAGESCIPTHNSELASVIALQWAQKASKRNPVWWVAPTYDLCEPGLDASEELYPPEWIERIRTTPGNMGIDFVWGGVLEFKSAEKERTLRGRGLRGLLVEEAGEIKDGTWDILRPTLADFRAPAFVFGTPKGKNWFWKLAVRGMGDNRDADVEFFTAPTSVNPFIDPQEIENERARTPDRIFRQEWMAEFVADSGGVFPNPRRLVRGEPEDVPKAGELYVIGWDPAKQQDYSAVSVDRVSDRHTVHFQRWQKVPYMEQVKRVAAISRLYSAPVVLEVNNTGDPVHEMLAAEGIEVWPFKTTHASKQNIINNLALHIGEGSTSWPDYPILTNELEIYEWKNNGGSGAPSGWHDDSVMAKAFAVWGITRGASFLESREQGPTESITQYL